ncbi:MBL fold metallo-hydrolase [Halobaculum sp. CBA1158]|uniref:MBL fold metallo-hydrolase n=1 Tax=Halobaculum sp. CBA1158 TaxID=2904243 RepID=UPI001F3FAFEE|nr:MBL fold metallo-hydrolase [Halobaculum sp. CBA1158]UIP00518.1 MBL fold metallo-hydrolase [Halobaculum sp. CBA1158]
MTTEIDTAVDTVAPERLRQRIQAGDPVGLLDVRAPDTAEEWRIDGESIEYRNVPYYELLDGVPETVLAELPDEPLVVVCAKGESSELIAERLADAGVDAVSLDRGMRGWADLYDYTELAVDTDATVAQYHRPSSGCLAYLVADGDEAVVVDPLLAFVDAYRQDARALGAELVAAVDTHIHADHVSGVRELSARGVTGTLPESAVARGTAFEPDRTVADGDTITVGETTVEVLHTPGHTSGMTSLLVDGEVLLTGDGLFVDSVARPDLEDGDDGAPEAARQLYDTLQGLLSLDAEVVIAPAHASDGTPRRADGTYTATLGTVRERLPMLDADRETFVDRVLADMPPRPANYETIIDTNLGRVETDRADALTMELGPNNCAASAGGPGTRD